jgi:hypothetical protein
VWEFIQTWQGLLTIGSIMGTGAVSLLFIGRWLGHLTTKIEMFIHSNERALDRIEGSAVRAETAARKTSDRVATLEGKFDAWSKVE